MPPTGPLETQEDAASSTKTRGMLCTQRRYSPVRTAGLWTGFQGTGLNVDLRTQVHEKKVVRLLTCRIFKLFLFC